MLSQLHDPAEGSGRPSGTTTATASDRIAVKQGDRMLFVRLADVDWFEASGNYVEMHTTEGVHTVRQTMNELEGSLDPARFARIHRSLIVNLDRVRQIEPWFAGDQIVVLAGGQRLKMSRTYREQVMSRIHVL
jgi:two-component system, LytTR family, response regulator